MKFGLDNAVMVTNLDAAGFQIVNLGALSPIPADLVLTTDPRLSDARAPLDGTVTNASVSPAAAIVQSKLSLDGVIPAAWLGATSTTAARGDLAEFKSNKGIANGYASLDGAGHVPASQIPPGVGTGSVTSVALTMPAQFAITGSPVTTAGTLGITWNPVGALSWFGNPSGAAAVPTFQATPIPVGLVPGLDAAKIISGILAAVRLPEAVGVGAGHAKGAVPDPGATGDPDWYLCRGMTYKPLPVYFNSGLISQTGFSTDQYLDGSNIIVPEGGWVRGSQYRCRFEISKTAAGTASAVLRIRIGPTGTITDGMVASLTFPAGTPVADQGFVGVFFTLRLTGTSAQALYQINYAHNNQDDAGLWAARPFTITTPQFSSLFNSDTRSTIGISYNGGASFSGSIGLIQSSYAIPSNPP
jgi:hypothetical protein